MRILIYFLSSVGVCRVTVHFVHGADEMDNFVFGAIVGGVVGYFFLQEIRRRW